jgi:hypothetical protein
MPVKILEPGGQHVPLPRGALAVSEARELLAVRSLGCAFEPDGTPAEDTLCLRDEQGINRHRVPYELTESNVVSTSEEEVVWGGLLAHHFGHFLTESVSRLWPVLPGGELAGMPVVFTVPPKQPHPLDSTAVHDWLDAFGVQMVELPEQGAVRFNRMLVPETAWRLNTWIAPEVRDIHLHVRRGLDVPPSPRHDLLWLSRQGLHHQRVPYDEALLEWLLGKHITVIEPEKMPLAEQIAVLEGSRAVAGVVGSAFHALLMTTEPPECLYLCPPWDKSAYPAQHRFLETSADFAQVLSAAWTRSVRERGRIFFPFGYRLSIPETLRALNTTVLPTLFEDPRIAAFARPENHWPKDHRSEGDIDAAVASVLLDPLSIDARMNLGAMFETEGLLRCASEQFLAAALTGGSADASLRAARLLAHGGRLDEASIMAKQALAIDPDLREAASYTT